MTFRPCAIVPSHNHWTAAGQVVAGLRAAGLPVFVIDDGSQEPARAVLGALHDPEHGVTVFRLDVNQGKGGAVKQGFRLAAGQGFSHAVQVDADGQHDMAALPRLLEAAGQHPEALISGQPLFDGSIPTGRKIGRWITHVWVWVETLSLALPDSMCGFRVYPLAATTALLTTERVGQRMDFDTEIMVRLFWRGTPVVMIPVRVTYPPGNTSNFAMVRDNWRITCMHTRLVLTMLVRFPGILGRRWWPGAPSRHWASMSERGLYWGLRFCAEAYRRLGRRGCLMIMAPIVLYFFATGRDQRRASAAFLARAFAAGGAPRRPPSLLDGFRHFHSFSARALDTFITWVSGRPPGGMIRADGGVLDAITADPRGALFIVSHLGNAELIRAQLDPEVRDRLTVLVHTRHAEHYNRVLREFRPEAAVNTLQVTEVGPETAIMLKEQVDRGRWVVIAGDRTPVGGGQRVSRVPFLGSEASFSQGPYILAALLDCPVYLLFCLRDGKDHRLYAEKFADRIVLPRRDREGALQDWAERYARRLEHHALKAPLQWYNFFDFWAAPC